MEVYGIGHAGRFGNHVFRNMAAHFLAQRMNLRVSYSIDFEKAFGVKLFQGTRTTGRPVLMQENTFETYCSNGGASDDVLPDVNHIYCQTKTFARAIRSFFLSNEASIRAHNRFSYDNNAVFVHIRLDDATQWNPGADYYRRAVAKCEYTRGYVSSDSPNHSLVKEFLQKGFELVSLPEAETILFASACKSIVLSHGTFSWTIGALSFNSKVIYPKNFPVKWHGDIFLSEWEAL